MFELFLHNLSVPTTNNEEDTIKLLKEFEENNELIEVVYDDFEYDNKKVTYMDFVSKKDLVKEVCELSKQLQQSIVMDVVSNDCENGGLCYDIRAGKIISDEYIDPDFTSELWVEHENRYGDFLDESYGDFVDETES